MATLLNAWQSTTSSTDADASPAPSTATVQAAVPGVGISAGAAR